jgi:uncharacterized protein with HEPN domain
MSKRKPEFLISDIIDSCEKILSYTKAISFEEFIVDEKTVDAVIRNFEIIGEAANRLPESFKNQHNDINWQHIRGFRNRIIHEYFGIDYSIVWQIKEIYLTEMLQKLKEILKQNRNDLFE